MAKDKDSVVVGPDSTTSDVSTYQRAPEYAEFFGFQNRAAVFSFDKDTRVISRKLVWPDEPVAVARRDGVQFALPFKVRELRDRPMLPLGLTIVSGSTAAGKSTFIREMQKVIPIQRLLAVEPHDEPTELENLPTFSSVDAALAAAVRGSYSDPRVLYAIDSLRSTLFETTGAAGSKGMAMQFFTQITRVSNSLALAGVSVIATVNPMDEDQDYVKQFMTKLSASVPATILLDSVSRDNGGPTFSGTLQMRPNRTPMRFSFSALDKAPPAAELFAEFEFEPIQVGGNAVINKAAVAAISKAI